MKKIATIILNRNLPEVTDNLCDHLKKYDGDITDIFVIESGSDPKNLSKNMTWYANWSDAMLNGLRYARGMNFGLSQLWKENKFHKYDAFFLITNDTELPNSPSLSVMLEILKDHPKLGILSPCAQNWGEKFLLEKKETMYFWFIHNNAYFLRREFIETICNQDELNYMHFLFDGTNFRGYGLEHELITKGYINDWASGITNKVISNENESYLLNKSDLIKTEPYELNAALYVEEGKKWMKRKYGFRSHWAMQIYAKTFYDLFFESNPEFIEYKL